MPEVKEIIREMLKRGMDEQEVLATLREIGIENPETVLRDAMASMKEGGEAPAPASTEEKAAEPVTEAESEEAPAVVEEKELQPVTAASMEAVSNAAIEDKMDEALALLKALQDLNKKILETNRDILLRLKQ